MIALQYEACVRTRSRAATCAACVDACPEGAIAVDGGAISVTRDLCTGCGACVGACPTEAMSGPVDVAQVIAEVGAKVSCGEHGLPCVSALAVEDWLVIASGERRVRVEPCGRCGDRAADSLAERLGQARAALAALGMVTELVCVEREASPQRPSARQILLRASGEEAGDVRFDPLQLDPARLRTKQVPARRARLLAAVPPGSGSVPAAQVPWTSGKVLNVDTCTACRMCVNVCPTGALAASRRWDEITFDAAACVKCGLCHDVCAPGALTLAPEVELGALWAGRASLGKLPTRRCAECGEPFVSRDGAEVCARCADQDREARELVGWSHE